MISPFVTSIFSLGDSCCLIDTLTVADTPGPSSLLDEQLPQVSQLWRDVDGGGGVCRGLDEDGVRLGLGGGVCRGVDEVRDGVGLGRGVCRSVDGVRDGVGLGGGVCRGVDGVRDESGMGSRWRCVPRCGWGSG